MIDCIFCKIVTGVIPSANIYEDDLYLAFLGQTPINKGHTLVIPKEHYESIVDTPDALVAGSATILKKLAPQISEAMGAAGFNIGLNTGKAAGQVVFHLHWHIIPRFHNDGFDRWRERKIATGTELKAVAKKINII